jgi:hypothetical protein
MPVTWKKQYARILKCGYGATGDGNTVGIRHMQRIGLEITYPAVNNRRSEKYFRGIPGEH